MPFNVLREKLRKRAHKRENRAILARYYADGGDQGLRFDYHLGPDSLVLDVGGFEGQWASDLYARFRCKIHVFEPVKRFAEAIRQRFHDNPDIQIHALGLGGSTRRETIYIRGASSSLHRKRAESESIEVVDADVWLADNGLSDIALMKINIEGGEYELLERLIETGRIHSIGNLQIQFHNFWANAADRMQAIHESLSATHEPTYQYRFVWENWRRKETLG